MGARWVQTEVLGKYPAAPLRVYIVWLPMLPNDARSKWQGTGGLMRDPRVMHFWDENKVVGQGYAKQDGVFGTAWDTYYLYGSDAQWDTMAQPLISSGRTVIGKRSDLKRSFLPLLGVTSISGSTWRAGVHQAQQGQKRPFQQYR
jgi:hypothetical protein